MPRKSLKNVLIEIVLFVTMVALTGHLTANFWERYIVQNELSNMKSSLDHLKVTVHNIGDAYDDLQRDLIDLARINSKPSISPDEIFSCKKTRALDQKILRNLQVLLTKVNNKTPHLQTADKNIGNIPITNDSFAKNATTITRYPKKATAVGSESLTIANECPFRGECINNCKTKTNSHKCYDDCDSCSCTKYKYMKF